MRSQPFRDGYANALREAVARPHERVDEMNDPHARQVLRSAAYDLGHHVAKRRKRMAGAASSEARHRGRSPCG